MISGIKRREFNGSTKENVIFKTFRGAASKDMLSYAQPTLDWENLDAILIHVGINVVIVKRKTPIDIADSIISVGRKCKDSGINEVIVSSITRTKRSRF